MNLKAARQKYLQLGKELESLPQSPERQNAIHSHSKLGIFLDTEFGEDWRNATSPSCNYDKEFGDDKICNCGHPYYRHFDSYENMAHVGCKYCQCFNWTPFDTNRVILKFSDLAIGEKFTLVRDGNPSESISTYTKTEPTQKNESGYSMLCNAICLIDGVVRKEMSIGIMDDEEVEKIITKEQNGE